VGNLKILGLPDVAAAASATFTASSEASSSMADDNLRTQEPSEFWRSAGNKPTQTSFKCAFNKPNAFVADGVGLISHNLAPDTGWIRFILADEAIVEGDIWENVLVNAVEASTNTTVVFGDLDEGFTEDGNWGTPTTPGIPWTVSLGFATPAATPREAPGLATDFTYMESFWVYVKASAAPSYPASAPTVACYLNYNGAQIELLGTKAVTSATGQWLCFPWAYDANLYPSSALIRCDLSFTDGTSNEDVHLGSVVWRVERTNFASDTGVVSDTGWVLASEVQPIPGSSIQYLSEESPGFISNLYDFGSEKTGLIAVHCFIYEDHAPDLVAVDRATLAIVPPGYVEVGKFSVGLIFSPEVNFSYGDFFGSFDFSSQQNTDGGQEFGSRRFAKRTARLSLELLSTQEAHFIFDRLVRRKGVLGPVLISLIPDGDFEEAATTFYATLRNVETVMAANPAQGYERSLVLEFEEKL
jgi:hypothetical protein